jgi:hypothetical protein
VAILGSGVMAEEIAKACHECGVGVMVVSGSRERAEGLRGRLRRRFAGRRLRGPRGPGEVMLNGDLLVKLNREHPTCARACSRAVASR